MTKQYNNLQHKRNKSKIGNYNDNFAQLRMTRKEKDVLKSIYTQYIYTLLFILTLRTMTSLKTTTHILKELKVK